MEKIEKVIPALRVFKTNYEFIKDCADQNSNGSISGEIRKMLKYVDMNRTDYFSKLPDIEKFMKSDKRQIDKSKNYEKLKKQKEKIEKDLAKYESEEVL